FLRRPHRFTLFPYTTLFRSCRTFDYPESHDYFSQYNGNGLLPVLEATKIGGVPVWIQDKANVRGRFLCSIASIEPAISGTFQGIDRKSTRLNSSHVEISYAV